MFSGKNCGGMRNVFRKKTMIGLRMFSKKNCGRMGNVFREEPQPD